MFLVLNPLHLSSGRLNGVPFDATPIVLPENYRHRYDACPLGTVQSAKQPTRLRLSFPVNHARDYPGRVVRGVACRGNSVFLFFNGNFHFRLPERCGVSPVHRCIIGGARPTAPGSRLKRGKRETETDGNGPTRVRKRTTNGTYAERFGHVSTAARTTAQSGRDGVGGERTWSPSASGVGARVSANPRSDGTACDD